MLLRQAGGLRNMRSERSSLKSSLYADRPSLHSMAFDRKCQTIRGGKGKTRCLQALMAQGRVREPHATSVGMPSLKELTEEWAETMQIFPRPRVFPIALFAGAMKIGRAS